MSIFKSRGIVLKIHKVKTNDFLYTIFSKEYGKIICNKKLSKTEKTLDLGYLINFEITTKENVSIHKIKNIKIISEFNSNNKSFYKLNAYLTILSIINNKTPNGLVINELFDLLEILNSLLDIKEIELILFKLKIISIFGELNENNGNQIINRILKFINSNKINKILKLTGINNQIKKDLEEI